MSYRIEIERETRPGMLNVYGTAVAARSGNASTAPFGQLENARTWARRYAVALTSPSTCRVVDESGRTVTTYKGDGRGNVVCQNPAGPASVEV